MRDIAPFLLDQHGKLRVVPASVLAQTTREERAIFGVRHGLYSFPTTELVEHLREFIGCRSAIEIGAGTGVLARALGIPATDNRQQEEPTVRAYYDQLRQPVVPYGDDVEKLGAHEAIQKYKPQMTLSTQTTFRPLWAEFLNEPCRCC